MKKVILPLILMVLTAVIMGFQAVQVELSDTETPERHLLELKGYVKTPMAPSEAEVMVLPSDTRIEKARYTDSLGHEFDVSIIIGGRSKGSIHRPELCLPAQGFQMSEPTTINLMGISWHFMRLESAASGPCLHAYTFFNQAGYHTSSHTERIWRDVWDRSILMRTDHWVMVTVLGHGTDEVLMKRFLIDIEEVVK